MSSVKCLSSQFAVPKSAIFTCHVFVEIGRFKNRPSKSAEAFHAAGQGRLADTAGCELVPSGGGRVTW